MNFVFNILLIYFQEADYNLINPWEYTRNTNNILFYFFDLDNTLL
jgi:hypothetical protein